MDTLQPPEQKRFLNFMLGTQNFAIELSQVREVISLPSFTPMPGLAEHLMGLTNLRGEVIPLIDFRILLSIQPTLSLETGVIVCDLRPGLVGLVVDNIQNVMTPSADDTISSPKSTELSAQNVSNIIKRDNDLIMVLDVASLLKRNEPIDILKQANLKLVA